MRYHLFSCDTYYPSGALSDYEGSFDSLDEVRMHIAARTYGYDWDTVLVQNAEGNLVEVEL